MVLSPTEHAAYLLKLKEIKKKYETLEAEEKTKSMKAAAAAAKKKPKLQLNTETLKELQRLHRGRIQHHKHQYMKKYGKNYEATRFYRVVGTPAYLKNRDAELLKAVRDGDVELVHRLLKDGVDPARSPHILREVLIRSHNPNAGRIMRLLLAAGARTSSRSVFDLGFNPKNPGWSSEFNPDQRATPLTGAVLVDHGNLVDALLEAKAHVGTRNRQGMTALHHAARSGKVEIIKKLISAGANPHLRDRQGAGYTAFDYARGRNEIANRLNAISALSASSHKSVMHRGPVVKTQKALRAEALPWTGDLYKNVRRLRTNPNNKFITQSNNTMTAHHTNHALTRMMQSRTMLRAPETPPGVDVHGGGLYRGISGAAADTLKRTGVLVDPSYVATSLERSVSGNFASGGILLFFPFRNIPRGTPWIWFQNRPKSVGRKRHINRGTIASYSDESEVLLPPGTIRLVPGHPKNNHGARVAEFIPNPHFMKK